MAAAMRNWVATAEENVTWRNSPSGIMGSRARASQPMKPPSRAVPAASPARFWALPQPAWPPSTRPQVQRAHAAGAQARRGVVGAAGGAAAFLKPERRAGGGQDPDGDVPPEDPVPARALGDPAPDQRAGRHSEPGDPA